MIYIISAPSGTGKSTLIHNLLKNKTINIKKSVSYTTRPIRPGEHNNEHYIFISVSKFEKMIQHDDFLEYAVIFGNYYGTSRKMIEDTLSKNINVLLNIDWQGARQIRKKFSNICSIFMLPPSSKELSQRLFSRNQDNMEAINKRMKNIKKEITYFYEYDYLIINDNFDTALLDLESIVRSENLRIKYQKLKYKKLIKNFII